MKIFIAFAFFCLFAPFAKAQENALQEEAATETIGEEPLIHSILEATPEGYRLEVSDIDLSYAKYSTKLSQRTQRYLAAISQILREESSNYQSVEISGHSDSRGNSQRNFKLSKERAKGVAKLFHKSGLKSQKLKVRALAAAEPVADNGNDLGRRQNRRVEILIKTSPDKIESLAARLATIIPQKASESHAQMNEHDPVNALAVHDSGEQWEAVRDGTVWGR